MEQAKFQSPYLNETVINTPGIVKVLTGGKQFTIIIRDGRVEIESEFGKGMIVAPQSVGRVFIQQA